MHGSQMVWNVMQAIAQLAMQPPTMGITPPANKIFQERLFKYQQVVRK
jgi:catalase